MKKLNLYVAKEFLTFFLYTIFSFVMISTLFFALIQASKGKINELGWQAYLFKIVSNIPLLLEIVTPITTLLATILSLVSLSRHSEITAMKASGRSIIQIVTPVFLLSFVISGLSYANQSYLARLLGSAGDSTYGSLKRSVWKTNQRRLFYFEGVSEQSKSVELGFVYHFDENYVLQKQDFLKGLKNKNENWIAAQKSSFEVQEDKLLTSKVEKDRYPLEYFPEVFAEKIENPKYFPLETVVQVYLRQKKEGESIKKTEFIILKKVSNLFTGFIMVSLALPFTVFSQRESNFGKSIGIALLFGLSFWLIDQTFNALSKTDLVPAWVGAFGANFIFIILASTLIYRKQM